MKFFLWTLGWDSLPNNALLNHRSISSNPNCIFCHILEESIHVLRDCPRAKEVWNFFGLQNNFFQEDLHPWLTSNLSISSNCLISTAPWNTTFIFCIWNIWIRRNTWIFNKTSQNLQSFFKGLLISIQNFIIAKPHLQVIQNKASGSFDILFNKGPFALVDASFSHETKCAGLAVCWFDQQGKWLRAKCTNICTTDATTAEAMAIKCAISWSSDQSAGISTIYSDCKVCVEGIMGQPVKDKLMNHYDVCREELKKLHRARIEHIPRKLNAPADRLANEARKHCVLGDYLLFNVIPPPLVLEFLDDLLRLKGPTNEA